MAKTVKQLDEEVQDLKQEAGNAHLTVYTVWSWEQIAKLTEEYDRYGELIKLEVTSGFSSTKRNYTVIIWHYPLLNRDERLQASKNGDYYQQLRDTKEHI